MCLGHPRIGGLRGKVLGAYSYRHTDPLRWVNITAFKYMGSALSIKLMLIMVQKTLEAAIMASTVPRFTSSRSYAEILGGVGCRTTKIPEMKVYIRSVRGSLKKEIMKHKRKDKVNPR